MIFKDNPEMDALLPLSSAGSSCLPEQISTGKHTNQIELTSLNQRTDTVQVQLVPYSDHSDSERALNEIDENVTNKPKKQMRYYVDRSAWDR